MFSRLPLFLWFALLVLTQIALAQGRYRVGDRVDIDIIMAGAPERAMWRPGVIVRIEGRNYVVRMEDGEERGMPIFKEADWLRPGTGAAPNTPVPANPEAATGGPLQAGQRVDIDVIMAGAPERRMWRAGTLLRIEGNRYIVRLDDGDERSIPRREDWQWIRAGGGAPPAAQNPPATPRANPSATPPATAQTPAAETKERGLGAPPDGIYNCEKIGGGGDAMIGLGKLEIRGRTYRGINEAGQGAFHPYSVDGSGNITWSAGLTGMPEGWTILSSVYTGLEHMGRPIIKISYRSKSGWNDMIDCVRD